MNIKQLGSIVTGRLRAVPRQDFTIATVSRYPELALAKARLPRGPLPLTPPKDGARLLIDGRQFYSIEDILSVSSGALPDTRDYQPVQLMLGYISENLPEDLRGRVYASHIVRQGHGYVDGVFNVDSFLKSISFHHFGMAIDFQVVNERDEPRLNDYLMSVIRKLDLRTDSYHGYGRSIAREHRTSKRPLFHFAFDKVPVGDDVVPVSKLIKVVYGK